MNNKKTVPAFPNFSWRTVISKKQVAKIRTKDKNNYKLFKRQPYKMIKYTQTIRRLLPTNCLSVLDHFVVLALKGLNASLFCILQINRNSEAYLELS